MRSPLRYSPKASRGRGVVTNVVLGVGLITGLTIFVLIGLRAPTSIPGRAYYTISAEFADGANIAAHADVKIAGKRVGQVLRPRFENGRTVVDLQIDRSAAPLRSGTTVRLRPKSAIGQPYVDLKPGTNGTPLGENTRIPVTKTSSAVQIDRLLTAFDAPTRSRFQELMRELGRGTAGTGEGLNKALSNQVMLDDLDRVTARLAAEPQALRGFVRNTADVARAFAGVRYDFARLFRPAADVMSTLERERTSLDTVFDVAPDVLRATRGNLLRSDPAFDQAERFARHALPALRLAPAALRDTTRMLRTGRTTVPQLDRTLLLAQAAVPPTLSLLSSARSAARPLEDFMGAANPTVDELAPRRCDIVRLARNWQNLFAYGEPKQQGKNTLAVEVATPGSRAFGGDLKAGRTQIVADTPLARNPYPAPCESWHDSRRLAAGNGGGR